MILYALESLSNILFVICLCHKLSVKIRIHNQKGHGTVYPEMNPALVSLSSLV